LKPILAIQQNSFYGVFLFNPLPPSDAVWKQKKMDLFTSVFSEFKNYHPSGNLKFNHVGISQSLKLRNLMGKIL